MYRTFEHMLLILIEGKHLYLDPIWLSQIDLMLGSNDFYRVSITEVLS